MVFYFTANGNSLYVARGLDRELVSYDPETCRMVGEVVNVCADESVRTDGKIDPVKLITYDGMNHTYLVLGEKVGNAFSDGAKLKQRVTANDLHPF